MQLSQVVASRLNMQPALISPTHGAILADSLRQLAAADPDREEAAQQVARANLLAAYGYSSDEREKPFAFSAGVAVIPITGLLINRFDRSWGWVTGYNAIRSQLEAAMADDDVRAIVFDCNSGGGEVAGCFELAADIRAARGKKPMTAVVDSNSYSACYALASAADRIVVTPSGGVGSVGVVAMHVDYSKALDEAGIKVTFIYSGDHKVEGNPYEPLPEPVRKSIQARVDNTRQEFVALVAANRGLDTKVVFDTQAACFTAAEALDLGFVDAIATPREAVKALFQELSGSQFAQEQPMSTKAESAGAESNTATPDTTNHAAEARKAERERIAAIQGHANAKDKPALAAHLALNTEMSVDDAAALMAVAAPETKEPAADNGASHFSAAMDTSDHPNVGADAGASSGEMTPAQRILAAQAAATGVRH